MPSSRALEVPFARAPSACGSSPPGCPRRARCPRRSSPAASRRAALRKPGCTSPRSSSFSTKANSALHSELVYDGQSSRFAGVSSITAPRRPHRRRRARRFASTPFLRKWLTSCPFTMVTVRPSRPSSVSGSLSMSVKRRRYAFCIASIAVRTCWGCLPDDGEDLRSRTAGRARCDGRSGGSGVAAAMTDGAHGLARGRRASSEGGGLRNRRRWASPSMVGGLLTDRRGWASSFGVGRPPGSRRGGLPPSAPEASGIGLAGFPSGREAASSPIEEAAAIAEEGSSESAGARTMILLGSRKEQSHVDFGSRGCGVSSGFPGKGRKLATRKRKRP